jgi:hypothetical protein
MRLSTLQMTPRDVTRKTEGQDGVAVSFLVGLFHSLQHAGLSRRTLINATYQDLSKFGGGSGREWNHGWLSGLQCLGSPCIFLEFASRK